MSITVREILKMEPFTSCRLVSGEGGLSNIVKYTTTMEMPDIRTWLNRDLLLITTGYAIRSKIDLSVHKQVQIEQDGYCFDVCMDDEGASLLINSREQIFTEKLRSLLRFGPLSTRFKDVFDLCYLADQVDGTRLAICVNTYIFADPGMKENDYSAIRTRVRRTFSDSTYRQRLERSRASNWMGISPAEAMEKIEEFLSDL